MKKFGIIFIVCVLGTSLVACSQDDVSVTIVETLPRVTEGVISSFDEVPSTETSPNYTEPQKATEGSDKVVIESSGGLKYNKAYIAELGENIVEYVFREDGSCDIYWDNGLYNHNTDLSFGNNEILLENEPFLIISDDGSKIALSDTDTWIFKLQKSPESEFVFGDYKCISTEEYMPVIVINEDGSGAFIFEDNIEEYPAGAIVVNNTAHTITFGESITGYIHPDGMRFGIDGEVYALQQ